jgi:Leucine-rich repeat (LRR) protein
MMKRKFVLFFLLSTNSIFAQLDSVHVYDWSELQGELNPDTVFAISMSKLKLDSLPKELFAFRNLIYLDLSKNKLISLPDDFSSLEQLKVINLEKNRIDIFPITFCRMTNLKTLILNRNFIEQIPNCIERLNQLEFIDLYDNPIHTLPETLTTMSSLKKIDFTGIRFSPTFQKTWRQKLPTVELIFDAPCDCME